MTREQLLARARAASKRLDDANQELDAAERNHRIAWQEWEDFEDTKSLAPAVPDGEAKPSGTANEGEWKHGL
jgi:hypothetical protein